MLNFSKIREFEDFWFGYDTDPSKIQTMFEEVWNKAVEDEMADKEGGFAAVNGKHGNQDDRAIEYVPAIFLEIPFPWLADEAD